MWHGNRLMNVYKVETAEELAEELCRTQHDLSRGFLLGDRYWLNDSLTTDPDRHTEYAVVKVDTLEQIDSITISRFIDTLYKEAAVNSLTKIINECAEDDGDPLCIKAFGSIFIEQIVMHEGKCA